MTVQPRYIRQIANPTVILRAASVEVGGLGSFNTAIYEEVTGIPPAGSTIDPVAVQVQRGNGEVNLLDFGADPTFSVTSQPAMDAATAYCLAYGKSLYAPAGRYMLTKRFAPTFKVRGDSSGEWRLNTTAVDDKGTNFIFVGTGAKDLTLDMCSNMDTGGGKILNPAFGKTGVSSTLSQYYQIGDYTNANASTLTAAPATLKAFSCAVYLAPGGGGSLEGIRIVPGRASDGLAIYRDATYAGLADNWDIGLWLDNHDQASIENVKVVGYWRTRGVLMSYVSKAMGDSPSAEYNVFRQLTVQMGMEVRGPDKFRVTAVTSTTIEVPWSASHRWMGPLDPAWTGSARFRKGSTSYTYTGISKSGDKLTLTGISSTTGILVGDKVRNLRDNDSGNFGCSGTRFYGSVFAGLSHASRVQATSSALTTPYPFATPGLIASGDPNRALDFIGCTFLSGDEVAIQFHDVNDPGFMPCYGEGQSGWEDIAHATTVSSGARVICSPFEGDNTNAPYPAGETGQLRDFGSSWNQSLDFWPMYASTSCGKFMPLLPAVSSITRGVAPDANTTARVTTATAHGLTTGDQVFIRGADQQEYEGLKTVTVTSSTTFTYAVPIYTTTPATGLLLSASRYYGGLFNPRSIVGLGKGFQPADGQLRLRLPSGQSMEFGTEFGNAVLKAINGQLDLQSDTVNDSLLLRAGNVTGQDIRSNRNIMVNAVDLPSYTVAATVPGVSEQLPSAATSAGLEVYVTDESGGPVPAFSDGSNWRRVTDRAIVS